MKIQISCESWFAEATQDMQSLRHGCSTRPNNACVKLSTCLCKDTKSHVDRVYEYDSDRAIRLDPGKGCGGSLFQAQVINMNSLAVIHHVLD